MIKVTVKDREFLKAITTEQITKYLELTGWVKGDERKNDKDEITGQYYKKQGEEKTVLACVPSSQDLPDYVSRITEIIYEMEKITNKSQIQIFSDITRKTFIVKPTNKKDLNK